MTIEISHSELLDLQNHITQANKILEKCIKRYYEDQRGDFEPQTYVMVWDEDEADKKYAVYMGHNPDSEFPHICYMFNDNGEVVEMGRNYKHAKRMSTDEINELLRLTGTTL